LPTRKISRDAEFCRIQINALWRLICKMAWAKDLAHPVSRHTLCQPQGRQAFSAKTCSILSQLAAQPTTEGQAFQIKALKANRALWLSLPLSVRDRLETYDVLVIAAAQPPAPTRLAR
jgi:hypothetical protein